MISVIISIYKALDNLHLILLGLDRQTYKNFEVIVSEDNDANRTISFLEDMRKQFKFTIKHVSQEDIGFRKNRILNHALLAASGEYLVFLDGDCVPHKHLLEAYAKNLTQENVCLGRRCYINKKLTDKVLRSRKVNQINLISILLNKSKQIEHGIYIPYLKKENTTRKIMGCNFGVSLRNMLEINGFDEDYPKASVGEDQDVDWRLRRKGLRFDNIKHQVVVFHLYHKTHYGNKERDEMKAIMYKKMEEGFFVCKNGINKL